MIVAPGISSLVKPLRRAAATPARSAAPLQWSLPIKSGAGSDPAIHQVA